MHSVGHQSRAFSTPGQHLQEVIEDRQQLVSLATSSLKKEQISVQPTSQPLDRIQQYRHYLHIR